MQTGADFDRIREREDNRYLDERWMDNDRQPPPEPDEQADQDRQPGGKDFDYFALAVALMRAHK